jgi:hypothetical protein
VHSVDGGFCVPAVQSQIGGLSSIGAILNS